MRSFMYKLSGGALEGVCFGSDYDTTALADLPVSDRLKGFEFVETTNFTFNPDLIMEQLYFDGAVLIENLKYDVTWENCVMPLFLIRSKYVNRERQAISDLLNSENPNVLMIMQKQADLNALPGTDNLGFWYQVALSGLAHAEIEKPIIAAKLAMKLAEL